MLFNDIEYHVIAFGNQMFKTQYRLGDKSMEWIGATKNLGVIIQSDLKFNKHLDGAKESESITNSRNIQT